MAIPVSPEVLRYPNAKGPLDYDPFSLNFGAWLELLAGDVLSSTVSSTIVRSDGQPNDIIIQSIAVNTAELWMRGRCYPAYTVVTAWLSDGTIGIEYTWTVSVSAVPSNRVGGRSAVIPLTLR